MMLQENIEYLLLIVITKDYNFLIVNFLKLLNIIYIFIKFA